MEEGNADFVQEIMNLLELLGREFAGMNAFHLSGQPAGDWSYDRVLSQAVITYRPKSLSISASALGGRGNGVTSRVMRVRWPGVRWRVPLSSTISAA